MMNTKQLVLMQHLQHYTLMRGVLFLLFIAETTVPSR